jgi:hypothetical protein
MVVASGDGYQDWIAVQGPYLAQIEQQLRFKAQARLIIVTLLGLPPARHVTPTYSSARMQERAQKRSGYCRVRATDAESVV